MGVLENEMKRKTKRSSKRLVKNIELFPKNLRVREYPRV